MTLARNGARTATGGAIAVRDAGDADMAAIQRIYAHHVLHGLASFEEVPPTAAVLAERRDRTRGHGLPYLAAAIDGQVVGYCYAALYRTRPAYRHTVEDSVYVAPDFAGRGIGKALLRALIARCEAGAWRQMVAIIGDSGNDASIALHRSLGFAEAGTLHAVGFKFGRWVDSVFMQRPLGPGSATLPAEASRASAER